MAGFLYFAPVAVAPTLDDVRAWGLGYAFAKQPFAREVKGETPSGAAGYVFADAKRLGERTAKLEDGQTWRKIPGRDGQQEVWVGYWNDAKPTPGDLARGELLAGYPLTMADGQEWKVPAVRSFDAETEKPIPALPYRYTVDDAGKLTRGKILEAHRWLWDLTESAWQAMVVNGDIGNQEALETAGGLFSANYAAHWFELANEDLLGVFSPALSPAVVVALSIDFTTWSGWSAAKKKSLSHSQTDDGSSSSSGEMDSPQLTPQLAQIS